MIITSAYISVGRNDCLDGIKMVGCKITCDFPIWSKDYNHNDPNVKFEIYDSIPGASDEYKRVFKNSSILNCIIDAPEIH